MSGSNFDKAGSSINVAELYRSTIIIYYWLDQIFVRFDCNHCYELQVFPPLSIQNAEDTHNALMHRNMYTISTENGS